MLSMLALSTETNNKAKYNKSIIIIYRDAFIFSLSEYAYVIM